MQAVSYLSIIYMLFVLSESYKHRSLTYFIFIKQGPLVQKKWCLWDVMLTKLTWCSCCFLLVSL